MKIRRAVPEDAEALAGILNHYIEKTTTTFYTEPLTIESRRAWIETRNELHPGLVLEIDHSVAGVCGLVEFKPRQAYRRTVESMVYLRDGLQGRGHGTELLRMLISEARRVGHHAMIACICAEQTASIRAHEKVGFKEVGHLKQVGYKFDRWLDVVYMELLLSA
jgi:phosphinothricin acetyltransferase